MGFREEDDYELDNKVEFEGPERKKMAGNITVVADYAAPRSRIRQWCGGFGNGTMVTGNGFGDGGGGKVFIH